MILNHKYKFIFIKSFKTAGTSLEIALSKFCGNKDIITPIVKEDERLRSKLNFTPPQNYEGMREHMSATEIKNKIGTELFNDFFKFVVIRNPYEQVISAYYWHNESKKKEKKFFLFKKKPISFDKFFKRKIHHIFEDEINRYSENGKVLVDQFVRYENFKDDLTKVSETLKLPENIYDIFKSIKAKSKIRPSLEKAVKLNNEHKCQINKYARKIITLHNYKI